MFSSNIAVGVLKTKINISILKIEILKKIIIFEKIFILLIVCINWSINVFFFKFDIRIGFFN